MVKKKGWCQKVHASAPKKTHPRLFSGKHDFGENNVCSQINVYLINLDNFNTLNNSDN